MKTRWVVFFTFIVLLLVVGCGGKTPSSTIPPATTPSSTTPSLTIPSPIPPSSTTIIPSTTTTITTATTTVKPSPTTTTTTTQARPPAAVKGLVYKRDGALNITVDAAILPLRLSGATVTVGQNVMPTGADGTYNIATVPAGFQTITVTKDGYIPQKLSWTFESGKTYTFNIGLYPAPAAILAHEGFFKGIITWDAGGWLNDVYYKRGLFPPTYTAAVQNAGASLVTVSDPVFIKSATATQVVMGTVSNTGNHWRMMNETEYSALVKDAHGKGLQFMLWLGVMDTGDTPYSQIVWKDGLHEDHFWESWFSEYEKYAVQYAAMAEKLGIEYLNLGHDMGYATGASHYEGGPTECLNRWKRLIDAVRAVYHGKLTYFGGVAPNDNVFEDADYAPGFIKLFDAIGINVQSIHPKFNPSVAELKINAGKLFDRYIDCERPVFVMVRTPSVDGGTSFDTYIEPLLVVNREADKHALNLLQQADFYQAIFELLNQRSVGPGQIMGVFTWGYNYYDDYLAVPDKSDGAMAMDKSANIRGKPAEAVMKYWNFRK